MKSTDTYNDIKEVNLSYLMLAQNMVRSDREAAIFRLGISEEIADVLARLTPGQVLKMASSDMLLCNFRFDDTLLLGGEGGLDDGLSGARQAKGLDNAPLGNKRGLHVLGHFRRLGREHGPSRHGGSDCQNQHTIHFFHENYLFSPRKGDVSRRKPMFQTSV